MIADARQGAEFSVHVSDRQLGRTDAGRSYRASLEPLHRAKV